MITLKQDNDGEVVFFQLDDTITADRLLDEFRRFMLAIGYAPESVKEAFTDELCAFDNLCVNDNN